MCDYQSSEKQDETKLGILNGKVYYLNKSQSKCINVGMNLSGFSPSLQFGGNKCKSIILSEEDWNSLLQYQGIITHYFCNNSFVTPIEERNFSITFEKIEQSPVIRVKQNDRYIILGSQSIYCLWHIVPIIEYRLDILKRQNFKTYFNVFKSNLKNYEDVLSQVSNIVSSNQNPNSENVSTMLELLHLYPDELETKLRNTSSNTQHNKNEFTISSNNRTCFENELAATNSSNNRKYFENELEAKLKNSSSKSNYYQEISYN